MEMTIYIVILDILQECNINTFYVFLLNLNCFSACAINQIIMQFFTLGL